MKQQSSFNPATTTDKKNKAVAIWLIVGVVMILFQILLGGITRLTGSGLSITEWKPIIGALPPMNHNEWNAAFEMYKQKAAGQFVNYNSHYTLSDFKAIYFWEWLHRDWARLMGIVFIVGFIIFWRKKYFEKSIIRPFVILFVIGALQGAAGWIMVMSGLNPEDTHVSHIKLALHFLLALLLLGYVFWIALKLLIPQERMVYIDKSTNWLLLSILVLLGIQLTYGAFMAGLRAATVATTWPDINGELIPTNTDTFGGETFLGIHRFTDNPIMIQFIHRSVAYLLLIIIVIWAIKIFSHLKHKPNKFLNNGVLLSLFFLVLQIVLGVLTVINGHLMTQSKFQIFEFFAEAHQMIAMFLLLSLLFCYYLIKKTEVKL